MPKVVWTPENDRKLLIRLIERSAKAYDTVDLATLFHGATPKAIEERIAKLKREAKAAANSPADPPPTPAAKKARTEAGKKADGSLKKAEGKGELRRGGRKRKKLFDDEQEDVVRDDDEMEEDVKLPEDSDDEDGDGEWKEERETEESAGLV